MNKHLWEYWLQTSSMLAVLIGVILVIIQLRQNEALIEYQILKQESDNYIESTLGLMPENLLEIRQKSLSEPENLTAAEFQVLEMWLWTDGVIRWKGLYDLAERGILEHEVWQVQVTEDAQWLLANPFGRAWWAYIRDEYDSIPPPLVSFIDASLSDASDNVIEDAFNEVKGRLKAAD